MANVYRCTLGFTIIGARNLVSRGAFQVDPLVVVRCYDRKYATAIKRGKAGVVCWDESHIWPGIEICKSDWDSALVVFEVQAANAFWRNDIIGSCSLQLSLIQSRTHHRIKRTLALKLMNDPGIKGYLTIVVYVLLPNDVPPSPTDAISDADSNDVDLENDITKAIIDTSQPERVEEGQAYHLYVSVHRIEHITRTKKGERDPFITCEFVGSKLTSSQARSTCNHTFMECFRIPVVTPVQEDSIIINIWDWNVFARDELIAHGRLSFNDLRSKPIAMRWYNFYSYDKDDFADENRTRDCSDWELNSYVGRLLLSARVERVERLDQLIPAQVISIRRQCDELQTFMVTLLADVYEVDGLPGERAAVEVAIGPVQQRTKWVRGELLNGEVAESSTTLLSTVAESLGMKQSRDLKRFNFDQANGRVPPLSVYVPTDEKQQWKLIISVYGELSGLGGKRTRLAYSCLSLKSVPAFLDSYSRTPAWFPLKWMPGLSEAMNQFGSVLMNIEKSFADTVIRGSRKFVSFQPYELRAYVYAARNLRRLGSRAPSACVRVNCAGYTGQTTGVQEDSVSPVFMECIKIQCSLATDASLNISTLVPITIMVLDVKKKRQFFIGRAVCHYDRVTSFSEGNFTLESLNPRWIILKRGRNGVNKPAGDILICLELIRKKDSLKVPPCVMQPYLRSCKLKLAVVGLRNLIRYGTDEVATTSRDLGGGPGARKPDQPKMVERPLILLSVGTYDSKSTTIKKLLIPWNPVSLSDSSSKNKAWSAQREASFDLMSVVEFECSLPEDPIFDPHITIAVYEKKVKKKYFIGDFTKSLLDIIPWIDDLEAAYIRVEAQNDFADTIDNRRLGLILKYVQNRARINKKGAASFGLLALKEADQELSLEKSQKTSEVQSTVLEKEHLTSKWVTPTGEPSILIEFYKRCLQDPLLSKPIVLDMTALNLFIPSKFVIACYGDMMEQSQDKKENFRPSVDGPLEEYLLDIWWRGEPIMKQMQNGTYVTGTVKFADAIEYRGKMKSSLPRDILPISFDETKLRTALRSEINLPASLTLRVYVPRAIALVSQNSASQINPYLEFVLGGRSEKLRGNAKMNDPNPQFCWIYEMNIMLPEQSSLEIAVWSKTSYNLAGNDVFIGSTQIDLEDRWFSREWQELMSANQVPTEYRILYNRSSNGEPRSCGTLELWVELMTLATAHEFPHVLLTQPIPVEVEIRVIVWGTRNLSFKGLKKDSIDAQVTVAIDCSGFKGLQPGSQSTDVHYYSRNGNALFNWRVVFSNVKLPVSSCILQASVFDYRSIGQSVFIGEVNVQLSSYLHKVSHDLSSREYDAEFPLSNRRFKASAEAPGHVQMTIQIMNQQEASAKPVGLGRNEPNREPRLTTPLYGRNWEDFLRTSGMSKDMRRLIMKIKVALTVLLFILLFVTGLIYPALFYQ